MTSWGGETVPWPDWCLISEVDWARKGRRLTAQPPLRVIVIDVRSDINRHPSASSHLCWFLEHAIVLTGSVCKAISEPGCIHVLVPVTVPTPPPPPLSPYIILWCLPSGTGIHFILQSPKTYLVCKFPLITYINNQTEVASLFFSVFPCPLLTEVHFWSRGFSLGVHVWTHGVWDLL